MCGIYSVIQNKNNNAGNEVLTGLKRLEYRGYDSWGVASLQCQSPNDKCQIKVEKHVGKISGVEKLELPNSSIAIGHTRWATHGGVSKQNAHPHLASDGSFALVHNGIIENYEELKAKLKKQAYKFKTETDTEVIVGLLEEELSKNPALESHLSGSAPQKPDVLSIKWREIIRKGFKKLEGRNTIAVLTNTDEVFAARNGSPLVIGFAKNDDIIVSSDTLSFAHRAKKMLVVENGQLIHITDGELKLYEMSSNKELNIKLEDVNVVDHKVDKEGFDHFMIKEINENPVVIRQVIAQDEDKLKALVSAIKKAKKVYSIGSGTAGIAAAQIAFYLRSIAKVEVTSLVGADCVDYFDFFDKDTLIISPSQSGETADVLEVLEIAKDRGAKLATYVNMQGSSMSRMADYNFQSQAGPEICVMSTKVFISQIAWGYLLAKATAGQTLDAKMQLNIAAKSLEKYLHDKRVIKQIKILAKKLSSAKDIFLMAKAQNMQVANEGMVKLIEASYRHAHAIPAGDLKHYAITIMEKGVPVLVLLSDDEVQTDVLTAAAEVKARGASVIGLSPKRHSSFESYLPIPEFKETNALAMTTALQLLSYYLTVELGNDVDHPRNIAKSVTVK